jgi:hypothetical protein
MVSWSERYNNKKEEIMENTKTIYENNGIKIVREQTYGFRCNNLQTMWYVYFNKKLCGGYPKLKKAKEFVQQLSL